MPNWDEIFDINNDGGVNVTDVNRWMEIINNDGNVTNQEQAFVNQLVNWVELQGNSDTTTWSSFTPPLPQEPGEGAGGLDTTLATPESFGIGSQRQVDAGISSGAVGDITELGRMLGQYKARTSLIQASSRQKAIFTID